LHSKDDEPLKLKALYPELLGLFVVLKFTKVEDIKKQMK